MLDSSGRLDPVCDAGHCRDRRVQVGKEANGYGGDDGRAESAKLAGVGQFERELDRRREDVEPRPAPGGPPAKRAERGDSGRSADVDMAAMLEGDTLVYGADHFRQAVP